MKPRQDLLTGLMIKKTFIFELLELKGEVKKRHVIYLKSSGFSESRKIENMLMILQKASSSADKTNCKQFNLTLY